VIVALSLLVLFNWSSALTAQRGEQGSAAVGGAPGAASVGSGQASAPFDLTGYWVSIVSDEWRYRMLTPPKGSVDYVPVNGEGRRVAQAWDPARDEAAGEACKGYGAGGIMRLPARLHITWQDPNTLRLDVDTGTQTRIMHFDQSQAPAPEVPSWQGFSAAQWEAAGGRGGQRAGQLKAVTTRLRPGYLRKNGVPYGDSAVLTEYYDLFQERDGTTMMFVTAVVQDPVYLEQRYIVISHFRKEPDGSKWDPSPCSARW
jgi:hypothetical protein